MERLLLDIHAHLSLKPQDLSTIVSMACQSATDALHNQIKLELGRAVAFETVAAISLHTIPKLLKNDVIKKNIMSVQPTRFCLEHYYEDKPEDKQNEQS